MMFWWHFIYWFLFYILFIVMLFIPLLSSSFNASFRLSQLLMAVLLTMCTICYCDFQSLFLGFNFTCRSCLYRMSLVLYLLFRFLNRLFFEGIRVECFFPVVSELNITLFLNFLLGGWPDNFLWLLFVIFMIPVSMSSASSSSMIVIASSIFVMVSPASLSARVFVSVV